MIFKKCLGVLQDDLIEAETQGPAPAVMNIHVVVNLGPGVWWNIPVPVRSLAILVSTVLVLSCGQTSDRQNHTQTWMIAYSLYSLLTHYRRREYWLNTFNHTHTHFICSKITVKAEVGKYNEQDSKAEHMTTAPRKKKTIKHTIKLTL